MMMIHDDDDDERTVEDEDEVEDEVEDEDEDQVENKNEVENENEVRNISEASVHWKEFFCFIGLGPLSAELFGELTISEPGRPRAGWARGIFHF